jgi:predicted MFS family arabinose efflux permease
LYSISFTMLVICIVARVPQVRKSRTLALSTNVAVFLFGVGGASFLGPIFSEKIAFAISLVCQFVSLLAAFFFLRNSPAINSPNKYFHLIESGSSASAGSAGILATESTSLLSGTKTAPHKVVAVSSGTSTPSSPSKPAVKSFSLAFHISRAWKIFVANRNIKILFLVAFFNYLTSDMLDQMLLLYLQESLNFSDNDQTYTIAVMSVASIMFVIFIAATRDHISDTWVLRMALFSSLVMTVLYAVVTNTLFAIMLPAVNVIGMAALPAVSSLTVDSVSPAEIGVGQGLVQAARVAAGAICPFLYGWLFQIAWDSDTSLQGWPFFVAAGCILISILVTFFLKIDSNRR